MNANIGNIEKDLLVLISKGNELAFKRIFDLYAKRLFAFAEDMVKSAADAEEIVQESFTKLWLNREKLGDIDNPGGYLYKIVRNSSLNYIRKVSREQKLIDQVWSYISHTDNSLEEHLLITESQELIQQALSQLPAQKQTVYRLSREKNYSHYQISSCTGLSKSRINNILVETLKHIRKYLEQHSGYLAILVWLYT